MANSQVTDISLDSQLVPCRVCDAEKQVSEFYPRQIKSDRSSGECKECTKSRIRKNRAENIDYYRSYDRMRYRESEERREHCHAAGRTTPMSVRVEKQRAKRKEDGNLRHNARQKVARAVAKGQIKKMDECFFCGTGQSLQAHHEDYTKPLDVFWLCPKCHGKLHTVTGDFHRDGASK